MCAAANLPCGVRASAACSVRRVARGAGTQMPRPLTRRIHTPTPARRPGSPTVGGEGCPTPARPGRFKFKVAGFDPWLLVMFPPPSSVLSPTPSLLPETISDWAARCARPTGSTTFDCARLRNMGVLPSFPGLTGDDVLFRLNPNAPPACPPRVLVLV